MTKPIGPDLVDVFNAYKANNGKRGLSKRWGIQRSVIWRWGNREKPISPKGALLICHATGTTEAPVVRWMASRLKLPVSFVDEVVESDAGQKGPGLLFTLLVARVLDCPVGWAASLLDAARGRTLNDADLPKD